LKGSKIAREGLAATPLGWGVGIMVVSWWGLFLARLVRVRGLIVSVNNWDVLVGGGWQQRFVSRVARSRETSLSSFGMAVNE
jgi:hypothetical protein